MSWFMYPVLLREIGEIDPCGFPTGNYFTLLSILVRDLLMRSLTYNLVSL